MAIRNSAPALGNRVLNWDTPPNSQSVIPSISMPSRRACHACPSSCRRSEAKNSRAATTAIARCTPRERPGFCEGKTPSASDQTIRAKITSQLQLIRTSTPPTLPRLTFPFTTRPFGFALPRSGIRLRRSAAAAIELSSSCRRPYGVAITVDRSSFGCSGRSGVGDATDRLRTTCRPRKAFCLRVDPFSGGWNDANVSPELEDEVVNVCRRQGTQGRQLCRRLLLVEDVEGPIADGATLQMRVGESGAEVGANDDRLDTRG